MKHILRQHQFSILATILLIGLSLLTLPMSYAVWKEVLGVSAGGDIGDQPLTATFVATMTPTVAQTLVPPTVLNTQTATPATPTDLPPTDPASTETSPTDPVPTEAPPTDVAPTEPPATSPPATDEPTVTPEPPPTEPPTELPAEPPVEAFTSGE